MKKDTLTFLELLNENAKNFPTNIAIRWKNIHVDYATLMNQIDNVARNAISFGMNAGDKFIFACKPTPTSLAVTLGLLKAGLTLVFVDPFTSPELFQNKINIIKPRFTLADNMLYTLSTPIARKLLILKNIVICDYSNAADINLFLGKKTWGVPHDAVKIIEWTKTSDKNIAIPKPNGDADSIITFTSGTTSDPKGVVHSLNTLSANLLPFSKTFNVKPADKIYCEPMTFGIVALSNAAEWHIPHKKDLIPDASLVFEVPTVLLDLIERAEKQTPTPKIKTVASGAAPVLPSLVNRILDTFGTETKVYSVYGMTEMLPVCIVDAKFKLTWSRGDLAGQPIGDTQLRISEEKEIFVRGSGLMKNYFGQPPEEWHATGDLGKLERDGSLTILGRKKNMFIRGNMNIYPSLYEPSINLIQGIKECMLVGIPNSYGDDYIVLAIVKDSEESDSKFTARIERELPQHMDADSMPDRILVVSEIVKSGRALKPDLQANTDIVRKKIGK